MLPHEVLQTALDGQAVGCTEALVTVGVPHILCHVNSAGLGIRGVVFPCRCSRCAYPCCPLCFDHFCRTGDKPELKHPQAAQQLRDLGFESSIGYIAHICALILRHTSLLPHVNTGVVSQAEAAVLQDVSVSAGLILESSSRVLLKPGRAHYDCPDKVPEVRLQAIRAFGELSSRLLSMY
jgi:2-iminoacetate synthase ThiH